MPINWDLLLPPSDLPRFGCTPGKVIVPPRLARLIEYRSYPVFGAPPRFWKPHIAKRNGLWCVIVTQYCVSQQHTEQALAFASNIPY